MEMNPTGAIHRPFTDPAGIPIQPAGAGGVKGTIVVSRLQSGFKSTNGC